MSWGFEDVEYRIYEHATGVPGPIAEAALRQAIREFARKTRAAQYNQDVIAIASVLTLSGPSEDPAARPQDILWVRAPEGQVDPKAATEEQLNREYPNWQTNTGHPRWYVRAAPAAIRLSPIGADGASYTIRASYVPSMGAAEYADELLDDWEDALVDGAIGRLKLQPGRQWSDPSGAMPFLRSFQAAVPEARSRADAGRTENVVRTVAYGGL